MEAFLSSPQGVSDCCIEPPLHANRGGRYVHFGKNVYADFGLTLVGDTHIYVGYNVMLAAARRVAAG